MNKKLEEYIQENRSGVDHETPPESVWNGIESQLTHSDRKASWNWMWKAATIGLLIVCGGLIFLLTNKEENLRYSLGDISEEYQQLESDYQVTITSLEKSLDMESIDTDDFAWVFEELEYLDKVNEQYQQDISEGLIDVQTIEALVDYYEKKLKLLKILELEINRKNNEKSRDIRL